MNLKKLLEEAMTGAKSKGEFLDAVKDHMRTWPRNKQEHFKKWNDLHLELAKMGNEDMEPNADMIECCESVRACIVEVLTEQTLEKLGIN